MLGTVDDAADVAQETCPRAWRPFGAHRLDKVTPPGGDGAVMFMARGCTLKPMTKSDAPKRHLPTSPFKAPVPPAVKQFVLGDQVTHDMYGLGRVVEVEEGVAALVDFGSARVRVLCPYTKMIKL